MVYDLVSGIIVLAIGIVLWAASRSVGDGTVSKVLYWIGIALIIVGVILIVVWLIQYVAGAAGLLAAFEGVKMLGIG